MVIMAADECKGDEKYRLILLDADGCTIRGKEDKKNDPKDRVYENPLSHNGFNHNLFKAIRDFIAQKSGSVIIAPGSRRTSARLDILNACLNQSMLFSTFFKKFKDQLVLLGLRNAVVDDHSLDDYSRDGYYAGGGTEVSYMAVMQEVEREYNEKARRDGGVCVRDCLQTGTVAMRSALMIDLQVSYLEHCGFPVLSSKMHAVSREGDLLSLSRRSREIMTEAFPNSKDDSKLMLLYWRLHDAAKKAKALGQDLEVMFVDDREDILGKLYTFISENPTVFPKCRLILKHHVAVSGERIHVFPDLICAGDIDEMPINTIKNLEATFFDRQGLENPRGIGKMLGQNDPFKWIRALIAPSLKAYSGNIVNRLSPVMAALKSNPSLARFIPSALHRFFLSQKVRDRPYASIVTADGKQHCAVQNGRPGIWRAVSNPGIGLDSVPKVDITRCPSRVGYS
jgi:hypothetical protein